MRLAWTARGEGATQAQARWLTAQPRRSPQSCSACARGGGCGRQTLISLMQGKKLALAG